jgi:hypothetical protein
MFGELGRDIARKGDDPRVRLDSDASGGELHVRADAVGDDGRSQTFRRLTAHVAGPDGFSRDVALEAVGAGRYAATVALARPGVYVATAKDELSGEAVGTTGAVLTAGEELRPTGSDRALLGRMAAMTGGKVRDTLAGLYDDRQGRRFAYTPLGAPLVLVAAVAMVLGVGARRLGVPDIVARAMAAARVRERRGRRGADLAAARAREAQRAAEQERVNATLLLAKQRASTQAPSARALGPAGPGVPTEIGGTAFMPRPEDASPAPPVPRSEARPLTAAERLVLKRRERR